MESVFFVLQPLVAKYQARRHNGHTCMHGTLLRCVPARTWECFAIAAWRTGAVSQVPSVSRTDPRSRSSGPRMVSGMPELRWQRGTAAAYIKRIHSMLRMLRRSSLGRDELNLVPCDEAPTAKQDLSGCGRHACAVFRRASQSVCACTAKPISSHVRRSALEDRKGLVNELTPIRMRHALSDLGCVYSVGLVVADFTCMAGRLWIRGSSAWCSHVLASPGPCPAFARPLE